MTMKQVQVVQQLFATAARGDIDGIAACLHPDFSIDQAHGTPYAGTHRGLDGFLQMFETLMSHFAIAQRDLVFHDTGEAEVGVIVTFNVDFTSRATGAQATSSNVELYRFTDGRIRHIDVYYKDAAAVAALAAVSAPDFAMTSSAR